MSTKFKCFIGDVIGYGDSQYLVKEIWPNGKPKILMNVQTKDLIYGDRPTTWDFVDWVMIKKAGEMPKYWEVCAKIKQMNEKRKELGYAF